jgi:hypothetical protein
MQQNNFSPIPHPIIIQRKKRGDSEWEKIHGKRGQSNCIKYNLSEI